MGTFISTIIFKICLDCNPIEENPWDDEWLVVVVYLNSLLLSDYKE